MLLITNASHDPYYNQAFEEYVFQKFQKEKLLMLWRSTPAVVCGCFQNVFAEVDVLQAQEQGVAVVRRITGGGTVYHDLGNWNYTMIRDADGTQDPYRGCLEPMVRALRRLGAPVSINRESDIAIDGQKVSGSAQKIVKGRLLHHGTLLYDCDLKALSSLANGQRACFESKGVKSVPWPVTNMKAHMEGCTMTSEEFGVQLLEAIAEEEPLEPVELSQEELKQVEQLREEKYHTWEWNYGKSPAFSYRRSFPFQGKEVTLEYQAKKGKIMECSMIPPVPELTEALTGECLSREQIAGVLKPWPEWRALLQYML